MSGVDVAFSGTTAARLRRRAIPEGLTGRSQVAKTAFHGPESGLDSQGGAKWGGINEPVASIGARLGLES
jgi:hypothetical protein